MSNPHEHAKRSGSPMTLPATIWQTVGPYFSIGLQPRYVTDIAGPRAAGERVLISGQVLDGDGVPIPDALLEIWQANAHGKYAHPEDTQDKPGDPGFLGHGRIPTDAFGRFTFITIKPGPVASADGRTQAPHLLVSLMMRGLLRRLTTRMYFPEEARNARDEILQLVPPERRATLLASPHATQPGTFGWDIHMQGESETVFFDF